jgi:hypothetical protein
LVKFVHNVQPPVVIFPDNQDYRRVGVAFVNPCEYPCPSAGRNRLHVAPPVKFVVHQAVEADELTKQLLLRKLALVGCMERFHELP